MAFAGDRGVAETGLYHYRARYYSPALGRFLTADPIGYGDGLNVYAYVANDPVTLVDPSGLGAQALADGVVAGFDLVVNNPHEALDVAGLVPAVGIAPDLLNAAGYALQGDFANAGVSLGAAEPIFGQGTAVGRLGKKAFDRSSGGTLFCGATPGS